MFEKEILLPVWGNLTIIYLQSFLFIYLFFYFLTR